MGHEPAAAPVTEKPVQVGADILDEYLEVVSSAYAQLFIFSQHGLIWFGLGAP